jgi:hypothetical protein
MEWDNVKEDLCEASERSGKRYRAYGCYLVRDSEGEGERGCMAIFGEKFKVVGTRWSLSGGHRRCCEESERAGVSGVTTRGELTPSYRSGEEGGTDLQAALGQPLQVLLRQALDNALLLKHNTLQRFESLPSIAHQRADLDLDLTLHLPPSLLDPPSLLGDKVIPARLRVIRLGVHPVLERAKLLDPLDLEHGERLGEGEDVKDEELELHPVWLGRLEGRAGGEVDGGDLLAGDVERHEGLEGVDSLEEGRGVKVVGDVGRSVGELARGGIPLLALLLGELGVLDDAERSSLSSDDPDALGLGDDFRSALGSLSDAVSEERRVGDSDEAVVDSVGVDELDLAFGNDGEDGVGRVG